ncbi:hypothetical protein [Halomonas heilongjiangensis]
MILLSLLVSAILWLFHR